MCVFGDKLKTSGYFPGVILRRKKMSKTIKNERTRGYLDELATQRRTRQAVRELKASVLNDIQDMLFNPPVAQDY
tara:strand:+ start:420 stop:644 length:225 start_codon:yes stop_codon:yes gene_type:complete